MLPKNSVGVLQYVAKLTLYLYEQNGHSIALLSFEVDEAPHFGRATLTGAI